MKSPRIRTSDPKHSEVPPDDVAKGLGAQPALEKQLADAKSITTQLTKQLEESEVTIGFWQKYAEGLEARIELYEMDVESRRKSTLSPFMQNVGAGLMSAALYNIGTSLFKSPKRNGPGDYNIKTDDLKARP